jgi:hypothetical protein
MQKITALLFLSLALLISSCKNRQSAPSSTPAAEIVTVTGTFKSVQGVMDPLSCYASNGGYVTQSNGERVAVSFTTESEITCASIEVKGNYITKTISSNPNSPCPAGTMKMLEVESYTCN